MPTLDEVVNDPEFHGLAQSERKKVLAAIDPDFAALPEIEQNKATMQLAQKFGKQPPVTKPIEPKIPAAEVASGAASNFIPSAVNVAKDMYQAMRHPLDTADALGSVLRGGAQKIVGPNVLGDATPEITPELAQKAGITPEEVAQQPPSDNRPQADAFGAFMADRYGGIENLKKTMRDDPAGFMLDVSTILTGGGAALSKAPGVAGKAGEVAKAIGAYTDPVTLAGKGMTAVGKGAAAAVPDVVKQKFTPEALYESAMKFSNNPRVLSPIDRRKAIKTGLEEKMLPNEESYRRLWDKVGENKAKVNAIVKEGGAAGVGVKTDQVTRMLDALEKRAAKIENYSPEYADALREARAKIESYGDNIPAESAQVLKETMQDLAKYGTDDRSNFTRAANKALGRGLRIQLENTFEGLKGLNENSAALLTLENELAKATGRIGNRDVVSLGMKIGIGASGPTSKGAGMLAGILDMPNVKARLALLLYEAKTGKKLPPSQWQTAAKIVFGKPSRLATAQAGNIEEQTNQENQP